MRVKFWIILIILIIVSTLFVVFAFTNNRKRVEYDHNIELPEEIKILICDSNTWNPLSKKNPLALIEMKRKDLEIFITNYRKNYNLCLQDFDNDNIKNYFGESKNDYSIHLSFIDKGEDILSVNFITMKDIPFDLSSCN